MKADGQQQLTREGKYKVAGGVQYQKHPYDPTHIGGLLQERLFQEILESLLASSELIHMQLHYTRQQLEVCVCVCALDEITGNLECVSEVSRFIPSSSLSITILVLFLSHSGSDPSED